jgi:RNA polymerase sigma factor (TIGR02999 family)
MTSGDPIDPSSDPGEITGWLRAAEAGDQSAIHRLFDSVYNELRRIARREIAAAGLHGTLNTTGLVHETYLKLSRGARWSVRDRRHFYATAGRAMRMVLLDDARHRMREKRGGGKAALPVEGIVAEARTPGSVEDLLALDQALTRLEAAAPELAQIVEWRFFAGLSDEEIAATLEVSDRTVRRQWRAAKAFLYRSLSGPEAGR